MKIYTEKPREAYEDFCFLFRLPTTVSYGCIKLNEVRTVSGHGESEEEEKL